MRVGFEAIEDAGLEMVEPGFELDAMAGLNEGDNPSIFFVVQWEFRLGSMSIGCRSRNCGSVWCVEAIEARFRTLSVSWAEVSTRQRSNRNR